jgi:ankyrin repeat protein
MHPVWAASPACLLLLPERCDPNLRHPRFARTILHDICGLGGASVEAAAPEMAMILLEAGALLTIRDGVLESTPLGWACRWGRIELVKLFLESGAHPP